MTKGMTEHLENRILIRGPLPAPGDISVGTMKMSTKLHTRGLKINPNSGPSIVIAVLPQTREHKPSGRLGSIVAHATPDDEEFDRPMFGTTRADTAEVAPEENRP